MNQEVIDRAIYDKYIEPTKHERSRFIGIEIEMPVVNLNKKPVEESVVLDMAAAFRKKFGFESAGTDSDGNINSMRDCTSGDDLSFDCSYSNLEISLGKGSNIFEVKNRFDSYYNFINEYFSDFNYTLTGMGINPYYSINYNKPIPNERYRMLYHYLHSYKKHEGETDVKFHNRADFGTFTSASQVQIDVRYENLIDVINTFGLLEPYKSLLFANSYLDEFPDLLCSRNMLWEHSMQGFNPHNIGMFEHKLGSIDELLEYIKTTSIYCTIRNGKYIDFTPVPISDYFRLKSVKGQYFDGEKYCETEFAPVIDDLKYLRTFKFEDLTFRGTIEYRSSCCQPINSSMTVAALHTGLLEKSEELKELLENDRIIYSHGYSAAELQRLFSKRELPSFADKKAVSGQLTKILDLASEGLKARNFGEELFIAPLYERAEKLSNPAKEMINGIENGLTIEHFIKEYSLIDKK